MCREHGQQLSALAAESSWSNNNVALLGIVKETGADDEGLVQFYKKYFTYPLYLDEERSLYAGFGNRKVGLTTWNPIRLWKGFREIGRRLKKKKLEGNMAGEGLIQGGILIFDKKGQLQYAVEEQIGSELDMDEIQMAVQAVLESGLGKNFAEEL